MEKPTTLRAGFIGLGTMGLPMARNLAKAGFALVVATRHFEKAEKFAQEVAGVRAVRTAAEVGKESDVIVSSVPDAPEVEEVHLGKNGTAPALQPEPAVSQRSPSPPRTARGTGQTVRDT